LKPQDNDFIHYGTGLEHPGNNSTSFATNGDKAVCGDYKLNLTLSFPGLRSAKIIGDKTVFIESIIQIIFYFSDIFEGEA